MSTITKDNTFSAGATIVASEHNANFDTIYNDYNGSITNANISASAAIVDTKLAQLTTASKVNLSALVISSQATGDIIYASSGTALARLAAGTSGNLLRSTGAAAPEWSNTLPAGSVLQIVNTQTAVTNNGTIPFIVDTTVPSNTEGNEYMTLAITPADTSNKLKIDSVVNVATNATAVTSILACLYQDAVTAAIAVASWGKGDAGANDTLHTIAFTHFLEAATTASTTFRIRAGGVTAGTTTFNSTTTVSAVFGGTVASSITITEISA